MTLPDRQVISPSSSSGSNQRKMLLISYHFPPGPEVGGLRAANFAEHLAAFGWTPQVLTRSERYIKVFDTERIKNLGGLHIIRTCQWPTVLDIYIRARERYDTLSQKVFGVGNTSGRSDSLNGHSSAAETVLQKVKRYIASIFLTLPDTERGWIIPAVWEAIKVVRKEKVDCILTSSPPYSVLLIGLLVRLFTGVRWVADFRDPWMIGGTKILPTCALSNKIERWLEGKVVEKADLVVFNVQRLRDAYKNVYQDEADNKFVYISNGINQSTFSRLRPMKRYQRFTLSYTGTLYVDRSPEPIFKAISELISEKRVKPGTINVKLVGHCEYVGDKPTWEMIDVYGLRSVVEVLEPVSYAQALEIIGRSHLALVFAPNQPFQIPGKIYDYLGVGVRILAIAEESATTELIQATKCGRAFCSSDVNGVKQFILQAMESNELNENCQSTIASKFDAKRITGLLCENLNRIVAGKGQSVNKD